MRRYLVSELREGPGTLSGDEAHHLVRVNRARAGQEIILFDGQGREARAVVTVVDRRGPSASLRIERPEFIERELPAPLEIFVAPPKGERMDALVRGLTELGASRIASLETERGLAGLGDHALLRWRRIAQEALKQCGRNRPPRIEGQLDLATSLVSPGLSRACAGSESPAETPTGAGADGSLCAPQREAALRAVALPGATQPLLQLLARGPLKGGIALWIGPEGGWTPAEETTLRAAGAEPFQLGPAILRIETAALVAAGLAQQHLLPSALPDRSQTL